MNTAETLEVMFSHQVLRRFPHLVHIKGGIRIEGISPPARGRELRVVDHIVVCLDGVAEPGMKVRRYFSGILHTDLSGKPDIERVREFFRRDSALRIEHGQIAQCMHAGIRPARAADLGLHTCQLRDRPIQFSLDGRDSAFLCLKSRISGAVIGHREQYSLHIRFPSCPAGIDPDGPPLWSVF